MAKLQRAIVEGGVTRYVDLTPEEEAEAMARVKASEEAEAARLALQAKVDAARARIVADAGLADLAVALGWKAPG